MEIPEFADIIDKVPNYSYYLSYEELEDNSRALAHEHPSIVKLIEAGHSGDGRPINALRIGGGSHNVLLYGFPNPEEPLGGLVLDYLSNALASGEKFLQKMDCTWFLIKCVDPDGAKLTEGYLKGPLTPYNFSKNFYRTPNRLTGELNFPYRYGNALNLNTPMPETSALMNIISGINFDFVSSLHVMKFGEMTFEVCRPCPEIYSSIQRTAKENGIPLRKRLGDIVAPGIQLAYYMTPAANYIKMKMRGIQSLQKVTGGFSFEFARMLNPNVFMMIPECTTWFDPRCYDDRPSGSKLAETVDYVGRFFGVSRKLISDSFEKARPHLDPNSPFVQFLDEIVEDIRSPKIGVINPDPLIRKEELDTETMVSQKISTEGRADIYRMFNIGAFVKMIDYQILKHGNNSSLAAIREKLQAILDDYNRQLETTYDVRHYPLGNLVTMNLSSLLIAIEYAKKTAVRPELYTN